MLSVLFHVGAILFALYVLTRLAAMSQEMSEYRTHGLSMHCDDPSAHYKITIGKGKARK
jgi:hypothetical protein